MLITKTFRYRLYPTRAQAVQLQEWLRICCKLYNRALMYKRRMWLEREQDVSLNQVQAKVTKLAQQDARLAAVNAQTRQAVVERLFRRYRRWYDKQLHTPPPALRVVNSLIFKQYVRLHAERRRVHLPRLGEIKVRLHRPVVGVVKQTQVVREVDQWYICFVVECPAPEPPPARQQVTALDPGLRAFLSDHLGNSVENKRIGAAHRPQVLALEARMRRQQPRSRRRRETLRRLRRLHRHIARERLSYQHQVTARIVREHEVIGIEQIGVQRLARGGGAAKPSEVQDVAWGQALRLLSCKAAWFGRQLVPVPAALTSKSCNVCSFVHRELGGEKRWKCAHCGTEHDRDRNAAINILRLALAQVKAQAAGTVARSATPAPGLVGREAARRVHIPA